MRHECDAAFALLKDRLEDTAEGGSGQSATCQKVGAVIGLGCAYAGTKRADVMESLTVLVVSTVQEPRVWSVTYTLPHIHCHAMSVIPLVTSLVRTSV